MSEIKVFEMFAGFGGASFALKKAGIKHMTVGYSEIDRYAIQCYEQNHAMYYSELWKKGTPCDKAYKVHNFGDVTKINPDEIPDFNLLTAGFPCQAFSVAGKGLGELDTRGTLFNEIIRVAAIKKPKYMLLENVKGLTNKKHKETFDKIISELERIGYYVQWQVLNSADYGIPQNRERVFFVCTRRDLFEPYLDDQIDWFEFPKKEELKIFLKDVLEEGNVDRDTSYCIDANYSKGTSYDDYKTKCRRQIVVHKIVGKVKIRKYPVNIKRLKELLRNNKTISCNEISKKLGVKKTKVEHWFRTDNCFAIPDSEVWFELKTLLDIKTDNFDKCITEFEIKDNKFDMANRVYSPYGISPTITTITGGKQLKVIDDIYGFRLMTPKECFRLMGFLNDEIKVEGISNSQQYKLAGNGWDINLVSKILKNLLKG